MDSFERFDYRGFTVAMADYGYVVMHDSSICGEYVFYRDALHAIDLWHKYFGDDTDE